MKACAFDFRCCGIVVFQSWDGSNFSPKIKIMGEEIALFCEHEGLPVGYRDWIYARGRMIEISLAPDFNLGQGI
ncbi:hypothetical protein [Persicobacter diffluens]|uniref:Uncharacterized protein n=1 Tax=Persicobacter diffluens TaxID=981 RepID=A0AAN4W195_9BACT|nr:hypothetical protein PEDI_34330 [Persicobacter diffluens]